MQRVLDLVSAVHDPERLRLLSRRDRMRGRDGRGVCRERVFWSRAVGVDCERVHERGARCKSGCQPQRSAEREPDPSGDGRTCTHCAANRTAAVACADEKSFARAGPRPGLGRR